MSDKATRLKEDRVKKFKDMGIPSPMTPIDPALLKNANADPDKLRKLDEIRNGLKKNEFRAFIDKSTPTKQFEEVPVPKAKKNPNAPKSQTPEIKSFSPDSSSSSEASLLERAMYGETSNPYTENRKSDSSNQAYSPVPRIMQEEANDDPNGSRFLSEFKSRMRSSASAKPFVKTSQSSQNIQNGFVISEEELEERIVSISTQVSKDMIKKVMTESIKSGSGIILETDKVKKAEIVGNGIIRLGGKLYKLTPVKQQ